MRLVQLTVPTGKRETVLETLDEREIDYVVTDETSNRGYAAVVYFPLPSAAVEPVLDELEAVGIDEEAYTVVVDAETVVSRRFQALRDEYEDGDVESERISRQELQTEAEEMTPTFGIYVTMTVISAVVATAGMLLDSPAVVVGSMVIAPLIGPALGASVGSVIDDEALFRQSLLYQLLGVVLAIASAAIFAWSVKTTNVVPPALEIASVAEISERLVPDLLSLVIALGAGVAGIVSIATGASVALVGVMIAAALIPPAAAAGIALAWGQPMAAIGPTVLVLVNVLSVNLAGLLTLWYAGYRPDNLFALSPTETRVRRRVVGLIAVVLILSAFLGVITHASYTAGTFEQEATEDVEQLLASEYQQYSLIDLEVKMNEDYPFLSPDRVIVTVGGPPGEAAPGLSNAIHEQVNERAENPVDVEVRFVDVIER
ncbi:TIGR00341 family protein [Halopiger djelfimassiliensis]|uniref:TIGR00341 family protein n=1 Tax=Halopiger djelfimassiliensis TaxID=1293047 RepID=UPI0006778F94|nr:TIGR00341 family protein [Halopiger djelfimassiliensis]